MPTKIQGFEVLTKPKDTSIESFPIFITVPANTTRVVTFPTEFNAVAIALQIENQDGANAASYIVSVTVTTGAAGVCVISGQMAALPKPIMGEVL